MAKSAAAAHSARPLFSGYGIEIEWTIIDRTDGKPRPLAELLLREGLEVFDERDRGVMGWSNELAAHVIEAKTAGVPPHLEGLASQFQTEAVEMNRRLASAGAMLVGGGAHPYMDPHRDATLWPHGQSEIYRAYDRIFGTQGHGWVNLQSVHVNLPFASDDELGRLHAAVRLVLPLIAALSAASPYLDGRRHPYLDARLDVYRRNQAKVPLVAGRVVPESIRSASDYHQRILAPMYRAIAPHDPEEILREEWLNSRGAIVRFDRSALEIRVIDCQENPHHDLAIAAAVVSAVRARIDAPPDFEDDAVEGSTDRLAAIFDAVARDAEAATISDEEYLRAMGWSRGPTTAGRLWRELLGRCASGFRARRRARRHH